MKDKLKHTALYERLSRDDEVDGESNSIVNQKMYLEQYARDNGFRNIRHFSDDGYSGVNFNRPAIKELLEEIEKGNIETVIVKDLSRFGRDHIMVDFYREIVFPDKRVRFIAVNNHYDSAKRKSNEFDYLPFINLMNEWYAKDTSAKITAVFKSRMQNGLRCSGAVPFGYYRVEGDKQTLHVDKDASKVIQRIFRLAAEGKGVVEIAEILTKDRVLIPSAYNEIHHPQDARCHSYHDPYLWTGTAVGYIIEKREYTGCTVLGKTVLENFKTKKRRKANEDELIIFPNTHEAIIDEETWKLANEVRKKKGRHRKLANGTFSHRLSGFVYCADCGSRLTFHSEHAQHRPDGKTYDADNYFKCPKAHIRYAEKCSTHYIKASTVEALVLLAIQTVSEYALNNEDDFLTQIDTQKDAGRDKEIRESKKRLTACRHRMNELDMLIKRLYEQNVLGKLSDRQYDRLIAEYDKEQGELEIEIDGLEKTLSGENDEAVRTDKFLAIVRKYTNCTELTTDMLHEFIDKVVVHAPTKERGKNRKQNVDIYFNFIGRIDLDCSYSNRGQRGNVLVPSLALFDNNAEDKAI